MKKPELIQHYWKGLGNANKSDNFAVLLVSDEFIK
jgi:hypothetical protein